MKSGEKEAHREDREQAATAGAHSHSVNGLALHMDRAVYPLFVITLIAICIIRMYQNPKKTFSALASQIPL